MKSYKHLYLSKKEIENSIFQQVMSKFRPDKFWIAQKLDTFIPYSQLEKLVVASLKKYQHQSFHK